MSASAQAHSPSPSGDFISLVASGRFEWLALISAAHRLPAAAARPRSAGRHDVLQCALDCVLHVAARRGLDHYVGLLLSRGGDPNAPSFEWEQLNGYAPDLPSSSSPLSACAEWGRGHVSTAALLMRHGARPDFAALDLAMRHGHVALLRCMRALGADVNVRNGIGHTVLHAAASRGQVRMAKLLGEELGADLSARTPTGDSLEDTARRWGRARFIEWLYMSGHVKVPAGSTAIAKRCHNLGELLLI